MQVTRKQRWTWSRPHKSRKHERNAELVAHFESGATLEETGQKFDVTRERARQIIKRDRPDLVRSPPREKPPPEPSPGEYSEKIIATKARNKVKPISELDRRIGQRLRLERMTQKLSQTAIAKKLGLTFQQVQKYEKGVNRIGGGRLLQIAGILDIPVTRLLDPNTPKNPSEDPLALAQSRPALRILQLWNNLGQEQRGAVIMLLEAMQPK